MTSGHNDNPLGVTDDAKAGSVSQDEPHWDGPADRIDTLLAVMARLRDPEVGCPWDVEQDFASIAPYTIEEAYEVADAIERRALAELPGELGDLLLQVVFHARMAEEAGLFAFGDVCRSIVEKMIRRHPHVFADQRGIDSAAAQTANWEDQKAAERAAAGRTAPQGILDGVAVALPGLVRAIKLQKRAARVGFDWDRLPPVLDKVREELAEVEAEAMSGDTDRIEAELGDLLFAVANLARHQDVDPERALRHANAKFERRFRHIESTITARGMSLEDASLDVMESLWQDAKRRERTG